MARRMLKEPFGFMLRFCSFSVILLLAFVFPLSAQVSPGPLSRAHEYLDSPLKCGNCHAFGAGAHKLKCMACHGEIRTLVRQQDGYHGRVVKKGDDDCARCHTEHYGRELRIYKWETSQDEFDHNQTGYPLLGRHGKLRCDQCHTEKYVALADRARIKVKDLNRTFEGLHPACLGCHEDRHAGQLGSDCAKCHSFVNWKLAQPFDHSTTKYPLTGKHREVECVKCHAASPTNAKVFQYKGLSFAACTPCHQDPHRGAFQQACESCHEIENWKRVRESNGFDHSKTKYPLTGKHAEVACLKCHKNSNFKTPVAFEKCLDCHKDEHKGQFTHRPDHGDCASCHVVKDWKPSTFTESSHQNTAYPLTGKHKGIECAKCHPGTGLEINYRPAFKACLDCHKDPHNAQFAGEPRANKCEDCHNVNGFHPATYSLKDHQTSKFALKGSHAAVACQDCHKKTPEGPADAQYHFVDLACEGCHTDTHQGQYPTSIVAKPGSGQSVCESCHGLVSWPQVKPFDHDLTKFALTGGHRSINCVACHVPVNVDEHTRTLPFKAAEKCEGCHEDIHGGQFQRDGVAVGCDRCHNTTRWAATDFDHETRTTFSLQGAHQDVPCKLCHTDHREVNGRTVVAYKDTPRDCSTCHR